MTWIFHVVKKWFIERLQKTLRLVGYRADWIATDRFGLTAEQIVQIYKLRWDIEKFFSWWKRHLRFYHLISRSEHGLKIQILAGLITYLLLAIYCHEEHGESVNIKRVRQLRSKILNETREADCGPCVSGRENNPPPRNLPASP